MESNSYKLIAELRDIRFVSATEICNKSTWHLCVVRAEKINENIFKSLFEEIELKYILNDKTFGIN